MQQPPPSLPPPFTTTTCTVSTDFAKKNWVCTYQLWCARQQQIFDSEGEARWQFWSLRLWWILSNPCSPDWKAELPAICTHTERQTLIRHQGDGKLYCENNKKTCTLPCCLSVLNNRYTHQTLYLIPKKLANRKLFSLSKICPHLRLTHTV